MSCLTEVVNTDPKLAQYVHSFVAFLIALPDLFGLPLIRLQGGISVQESSTLHVLMRASFKEVVLVRIALCNSAMK